MQSCLLASFSCVLVPGVIPPKMQGLTFPFAEFHENPFPITLFRSPVVASGLLVTPSSFVSLQISWPAPFLLIQVNNKEFKQ